MFQEKIPFLNDPNKETASQELSDLLLGDNNPV
jgi:hypothetical protein